MILEGREEDQGGDEMISGDKEGTWGKVGVRWERRDWGWEGRGWMDGWIW